MSRTRTDHLVDTSAQKASEEDKQKLVDRVDAFIFDCDGAAEHRLCSVLELA